ncbi:MAG: helix-turn-helix domain-containing protein [Syntrophobacteraceae bacterium]
MSLPWVTSTDVTGSLKVCLDDCRSIEGEGLLSIDELEKRYIATVLKRAVYNKAPTAQILNIPRTTLWRRMKEYHLESLRIYQNVHPPSYPPSTCPKLTASVYFMECMKSS